LADRTVVVVTADHGEEFMEHGSLEGHQWTLYDEVVLVPMIVRDPELPKNRDGQIIRQQISNVGLAGTLLDMLHIDNTWRGFSRLLNVRADAGRGNAGRGNAGPANSGKGDAGPANSGQGDAGKGDAGKGSRGERALLDLTVRRASREVGLRTPGYKLVRFADGSEQLFVRPRVGNETHDVSAQRRAETERLTGELDAMLDALTPIPGAGGERKPLTSIETERLRSTGYLN